MTTAFVLSGGGSLGAVQVGMLRALAARDIRPDLLVGTSAGAVNAAHVAGHGTDRRSLDELAAIWRGLHRRDVFPLAPLRHALALGGRRPSLCSSHALRRLIETHLAFERLEEAIIPLHVVTTDLLSGEEVLLSEGDAVSAVLASASIPGVLPAVERDGRVLVDGGVSDNTAVSQAIDLGADEVYVLPAGFPCALDHCPAGALGVALQSLTLLIEQRLIRDVAGTAGTGRLHVLPPLCPLAVSAIDFRHGDALMARAERTAGEWLDRGADDLPHPERFLALHHDTLDHDTLDHDTLQHDTLQHDTLQHDTRHDHVHVSE